MWYISQSNNKLGDKLHMIQAEFENGIEDEDARNRLPTWSQ